MKVNCIVCNGTGVVKYWDSKSGTFKTRSCMGCGGSGKVEM